MFSLKLIKLIIYNYDFRSWNVYSTVLFTVANAVQVDTPVTLNVPPIVKVASHHSCHV